MKILALRFKNLNSLYGEWRIDFTTSEYEENGVFALTGPTGAGKSTILDAICLALYGRTPRLDKITKSGNEIMSRKTGECFAEVTFATQAGTFRCFWGQHRARKSPDGELQDTRHEIIDAATDTIIESKRAHVKEAIEARTGMDFERFTRSALLAQGSFDSFLKADNEKKSQILERITGTKIYSAISVKTFERNKDEQNALALLKAEIAGVSLLTDAEETALKETLTLRRAQEAEAAARHEALGRAVAWREGIQRLEQELNAFHAQKQHLEAEKEAFASDRERLRLAQTANEAEAAYATLTASRTAQAKEESALREMDAALPALIEQQQSRAEAAAIAEKTRDAAGREYEQLLPVLRNVRQLDERLSGKKSEIAARLKEHTALRADIAGDTAALETAKARYEAALADRADKETYLHVNAHDAELPERFPYIETQLHALTEAGKKRELQARQEKEAEKKVDLAGQAHVKANAAHEETTKAQRSHEERLKALKEELAALLDGKLLREYRSEKDHAAREQAMIRHIRSLEEERRRLQDGKPCPLCGSTEHPYADGAVPEPDAFDKDIARLDNIISAAEEREERIAKEEASGKAYDEKAYKAKEALVRAEHEVTAAQQHLLRLREELATAAIERDQVRASAQRKAAPFGVTEEGLSDVPALIHTLKARADAWREATRKRDEADKAIEKEKAECERVASVIGAKRANLQTIADAKAALEKESEAIAQERFRLFAKKNADHEEKRVADARDAAERALQMAKDALERVKQAVTQKHMLREELSKAIEARVPEVKAHETTFAERLNILSIADENAFLAARMNEDERRRLAEKSAALESRAADLETRLSDRQARLKEETDKAPAEETLDRLRPMQEEAKRQHDALRTQNTLDDQKLKDNDAAKARMASKRQAIAAQEKECERWQKLSALIGSADGKKYRNFAQGLTFDFMITHANRQLARLSDRYLLGRDASKMLALNVIDNYRAGEIRPTDNLSGGESFIISLALALGLAHMASANVRVDSLFLDEGFGTLDENTLDMALDALSYVRQEGKLIGVISHIPAVKERISVHIDVTPVAGGKSVVRGTGVQHFAEPGR